MNGRSLPPDRLLRVVGDVHGDSVAFAHAIETDRFVVQLGDLVDHGPDSAGALRLACRLIDEERGLFLLGNHDRKLGRALSGHRMRPDPALEATLEQLDDGLRTRALDEIGHAPAWLRRGSMFFVHAVAARAARARAGGPSAVAGAVRGDNGTHADRWLSGACDALGGSDPVRHDGLLRA